MERTFLIVKPDGVQRGLVGEVIARWEKKGFKLVGLKFITASRAVVEEHYAEHKGKGFYEGLVNFLTSGPIATMVFEGKGCIAASRLLIGATNPLTAAPGTVRGDFGIDVGRNIIHGSDAPESAAREIKLWFKDEELQAWTPRAQPDIYEKI